MRIGLLGGSFDPVHSAHIALAREARDRLGLDLVLLMPSGEPPYKKCRASRMDRLNMVKLAVKGEKGMEVSDIEVMRSGETYAVDSLRILSEKYPGSEIVYLLGTDAAAKVRRWKGAEEVMRLSTIVCVKRAGCAEVPEGLEYLDVDLRDISSSAVRDMVCEGKDIKGLVPDGVYDYIREKGLYIAGMTEEEIIEDLEKRLKPSRFAHTLSVAKTAMEMARENGLAGGKAYIAGLVHDCAKNLSDDELDELADEAGADSEERLARQVLHAPVGAVVARKRYGINDPEIISAVRRHTIGGRGMSLLDMIIYVADFIEPGRKPFPGLEKVRSMAHRDVRRAALMCAESTRDYQAGQGARVHPATEEMIREIKNTEV